MNRQALEAWAKQRCGCLYCKEFQQPIPGGVCCQKDALINGHIHGLVEAIDRIENMDIGGVETALTLLTQDLNAVLEDGGT